MKGKGLRGRYSYLPLISEKSDAALDKKKRVKRKKTVQDIHSLTGAPHHKIHQALTHWEPRYG
jgi:hypothetical protein